MAAPLAAPVDSPSAFIGTALAVLAAAWAVVRWLFWPRIQAAIRGEVETAFHPLRQELASHVTSMDAGLARLAVSIDGLATRMQRLGERTAATGAAVDVLVDRRSGLDRRHDEPA